jgi:hypothetical protein
VQALPLKRVLALALLAGCATALPVRAAEEMAALPEPPPVCPFDGENREWTQRALHGWQRVNRNALKIAHPVPPVMVLFDAKCSFTLKPAADDTHPNTLTAGAVRYAVTGALHEGKIALPDGQTVPAQLTSFAAPLPDGTMAFVMALPPIWLAQAKGNNRALLATAVFMHEFTHTQSAGFGRRIDALVKRGLPADVDDDVIQSRFASRPGFAASFKREQEMLWEAAAAMNIKDARALSKRALRVIDNRRERYFNGPDAVYAPAEDLFLTLEGTGQYALYRWLTDPKGGAMAKPDAIAFARRDGKRWSQDQGLALYLVLDRLWVDWPPPTFGPQQQTVLEALRAAVEPTRK